MKSFGLYIHIPFCERKCHYCDFTSFPRKGKDIDKYVSFLIKELNLYKEKLADYKLETIFIGGGTPSAIDEKYIESILQYVHDNFDVENLKETTIEINPGTVNISKLQTYKALNINRISMGVQSLNNDILKSLGRIHTAEDVKHTLGLLKEVGFDNINMDFIFGLPDENLEDIKYNLNEIIKFDIEHISYYSLILEEGTLLNERYKENLISIPNEDLERDMYHHIVEFLKENNYHHYEISNFAKKDKECRHNLLYWKIKPYLGVGLNSHSNIFNKRFWNTSSFDNYYELLSEGNLPIEGEEPIDMNMEIAEYSIMGLRLVDGIDKYEFKTRFEKEIYEIYGEVLEKHIKNGLLIDDGKSIKLTAHGLDLANLVEVDFV